jgi:hypothetical protein
LVGAALTKALEIYQLRRDERSNDAERRRAGLDETRRLLYMIRWSTGEPSPELLATVANALVHHHGRTITDDELVFKLMRCGRTADEKQKEWLNDLIADLTKERDAIR